MEPLCTEYILYIFCIQNSPSRHLYRRTCQVNKLSVFLIYFEALFLSVSRYIRQMLNVRNIQHLDINTCRKCIPPSIASDGDGVGLLLLIVVFVYVNQPCWQMKRKARYELTLFFNQTIYTATYTLRFTLEVRKGVKAEVLNLCKLVHWIIYEVRFDIIFL